ncbi:MAG TPA: hypothetical protein VFX43_00275, partial [Chitinophagaceae bacterium]|nr:hypothetical protein [Chitinophagaceae bacterium]
IIFSIPMAKYKVNEAINRSKKRVRYTQVLEKDCRFRFRRGIWGEEESVRHSSSEKLTKITSTFKSPAWPMST